MGGRRQTLVQKLSRGDYFLPRLWKSGLTARSGAVRRVITRRPGCTTPGPFRWDGSDGSSPSLAGSPLENSCLSLGASTNPGGCRGQRLWPRAHPEPPIPPCHSPAQGTCPLLLNVARVPLTHASCAIFVGLIAPTASFIGPAPVASVGVDAHGFVSRTYKWELDAFIGVCKARGPLTRDVCAACPSLGFVCPLICDPGRVPPCWACPSTSVPLDCSSYPGPVHIGRVQAWSWVSSIHTTLPLDKLFMCG